MSAAASLHIIQSSEASARLRAAQRWLSARADRGALIVVGLPRRGRRPRARGRARRAGRRSACTASASRSSRRASPRRCSRRAGIAPATRIGSEAVAARATFDARQDGRARLLCDGGRRRRASRARSRGRSTTSRWPASRRRRCASCRSAARTSRSLLEGFDEQFAAASATGRAALFRRRVRGRWRRGAPAAPPARRADGIARRVRAGAQR